MTSIITSSKNKRGKSSRNTNSRKSGRKWNLPKLTPSEIVTCHSPQTQTLKRHISIQLFARSPEILYIDTRKTNGRGGGSCIQALETHKQYELQVRMQKLSICFKNISTPQIIQASRLAGRGRRKKKIMRIPGPSLSVN